MNVLKFEAKRKSERLVCSACGIDAACDCGAPYVTPGERAEAAVKASPDKSDRAIAEEIGVNNATVSRARKRSAVADATPEKRKGRDGKAYSVKRKSRAERAPKAVEREERVAKMMELGMSAKVIAEATGMHERNVDQALEHVDIAREARASLLDELKIDPVTLAPSAQAKLEIAKRLMQRRLDAEHAERMRGIDAEVRKLVVADGREHVERAKALEMKAWAEQQLWRKMINDHKPPLTIDEFNLLRRCLHQNGIAASPKDFDASFNLIQTKKLQLTGQK